MKTFADRFWTHVHVAGPDECWLWAGYRSNGVGYGNFRIGKTMTSAHRASWLVHNGPIPGALHVCHRCDNTGCVNPAHLWLGTNADNQRDKAVKGRAYSAIGELSNNAKLSSADVLNMRAELASGDSTRECARRYGVSQKSVMRIKHNERWRHLSGAA